MRFALCFLVAAFPALAQPVAACDDPNNVDPNACTAFFEFAPATGAGMGAPCACTSPTGAKGEALTFTRASSGTCLKGGTTTGIANGDMVTCASNQPRVMPGGDGSGGSGLLVEGARTNDLLRSQEIDNAAWSNQTFGAGAFTVTANAAVAPDGTTTAERLQIPAATSGQYTIRGQSLVASSRSGSFFVKGNAQSGTINLLIAGSSVACATCNYDPNTWTRCIQASPGSTANYSIGSDPLDCGGGNQPAKDVFVWGAQYEVGAYPSSYIATAGAAVTRALDSASFSLGTLDPAALSFAATAYFQPQYTAGANPLPMAIRSSATNYAGIYLSAGKATVNLRPGADNVQSSTANITLGAFNRVAAFTTGANKAVCLAGVCDEAAATIDFPSAAYVLWIGSFAASPDFQDGVVKRVCFDLASGRCR